MRERRNGSLALLSMSPNSNKKTLENIERAWVFDRLQAHAGNTIPNSLTVWCTYIYLKWLLPATGCITMLGTIPLKFVHAAANTLKHAG